MKYVMIKAGTAKYPIIFPEHLVHKEMSNAACRAINSQMPGSSPHPVSAGFWSPDSGETYGRSDSMDLDTNPYDALRILAGDSVAHLDDVLLKLMPLRKR